jgi:hypothetical protein
MSSGGHDVSWGPQHAEGAAASVDWSFDELLVLSNPSLVDLKSQETGGDLGGGLLLDAQGEHRRSRGKKNSLKGKRAPQVT